MKLFVSMLFLFSTAAFQASASILTSATAGSISQASFTGVAISVSDSSINANVSVGAHASILATQTSINGSTISTAFLIPTGCNSFVTCPDSGEFGKISATLSDTITFDVAPHGVSGLQFTYTSSLGSSVPAPNATASGHICLGAACEDLSAPGAFFTALSGLSANYMVQADASSMSEIGAGHIIPMADAGAMFNLTSIKFIDAMGNATIDFHYTTASGSPYPFTGGTFDAPPPGPSSTPEPASFGLYLLGFGTLALSSRRRGLMTKCFQTWDAGCGTRRKQHGASLTNTR